MQFIDNIIDTQNITDKPSCSSSCDFKQLSNIPIVGVPGPQKPNSLLGVIISRDPTTAFIQPYIGARAKSLDGWHHQLMTVPAPPQWIIGQISTFNRKYLDSKYTVEIVRLNEIMVNNVYWTHLHKCCTDKSSKEAPKFKTKNAQLCANQWLRQELSDAIVDGVKFIICVGNDAKAWLQEWENSAPEATGIQIFYLPHPSGAANGAWNPKDDEKMGNLRSNIENLLLFV
jgi:hypothetical protein